MFETLTREAATVQKTLAAWGAALVSDGASVPAGTLQELACWAARIENTAAAVKAAALAHAVCVEDVVTSEGEVVESRHPVGHIDEFSAAEAAIMIRTTVGAAGHAVAQGAAWVSRFPRLATLAAETGLTPAGVIHKILEITKPLTDAEATLVEDELLPILAGLDPSKITGTVRRVATRVAKESLEAAAVKEARSRSVRISPGPDGLTQWSAWLPSDQSAILWSAITTRAKDLQAHARSQAKVKANDQAAGAGSGAPRGDRMWGGAVPSLEAARADALFDLALTDVTVTTTLTLGIPVLATTGAAATVHRDTRSRVATEPQLRSGRQLSVDGDPLARLVATGALSEPAPDRWDHLPELPVDALRARHPHVAQAMDELAELGAGLEVPELEGPPDPHDPDLAGIAMIGAPLDWPRRPPPTAARTGLGAEGGDATSPRSGDASRRPGDRAPEAPDLAPDVGWAPHPPKKPHSPKNVSTEPSWDSPLDATDCSGAWVGGVTVPGVGWIPAAAVARLLTSLPLELSRALFDSRSGVTVETTSGLYRTPARIRHHVTTRDGTCRFPGCTRPATAHTDADQAIDLDHSRPWPLGSTTPAEMTSLCRRHHRTKQQKRWRHHLDPATGRVTWTTPHGVTVATEPEDHLGVRDVSGGPVVTGDAQRPTYDAPRF